MFDTLTTTAPATAVSTNPQIVLIDIQTAATMNPQRRPRPYLMPEFDGINEEGKDWRFRFTDKDGKLISPRLPLNIDISTEHGKKQLLVVKAYKMFIEPRIQIFNPMEAAEEEVMSADMMLDAMNELKTLRTNNDEETLINLSRRITGPVGNRTLDMVVAALVRVAQSEPKKILNLLKDPFFNQKVLVDKALEARMLIKRSDWFYYPETIFEGRLIAEGEVSLIQKMEHDSDLAAYIKQAATRVGSSQAFASAESLPVMPTLNEEQREALRSLQGAGSAVNNTDSKEGNPDELAELDEQAIRALVNKAIDGNFLGVVQDKVQMPDETLRTKPDAEAYFVQNPRAAAALRDEMNSIGIL